MDVKETQDVHWVNDDGVAHATVTQEVGFNLNWHVRVRLTELGINHWMELRRQQDQHSAHRKYWSEDTSEQYFLEDFAQEFNIHYQGDGWSRFQMWHMLALFGSLISEGAGLQTRLPFGTNIVLVKQELAFIDPVTV